jgi:hypothetical protein
MARPFFCVATIALVSFTCLKGQVYPVSDIPDSLRKNAHAVIRDYEVTIDLKSSNSYVQKTRKAISVFDEEGEKKAYLGVNYDKDSQVDIKQISVFDRDGKRYKSRQPAVADYAAFSSYEVFSDHRVKFYQPAFPDFPYTVEYNYEEKRTDILSLGYWKPVSDYDISLQHASLKLNYPANVVVNKKEVNIKCSSSVTKDGINTEFWELRNTKAIEDEPFDTDITERVPCVYLMPLVLSNGKYTGKADSWENYGKWIYDLYKGRDALTPEDSAKVLALTGEVPDVQGKIKALYRYLQENTRYVAVTLGLGGYQPFDAVTVRKTGYGDCKALSNYLYALLKAAGIESYPAIISAGKFRLPVFNDFPNFSQFNHVILCVPGNNDTTWLECTDQKIPFGFLGSFTDDRKALLITGQGGKFAHTSRYDPTENYRISRSEFVIDSTGAAICRTDMKFGGLQYDDLTSFLRSGADDQKKWLYSNSSLPSFQLKAFSVSENKVQQPSAAISETMVSRNYCSQSGNYTILPLNLVNAQKPVQRMVGERHSDVIINSSFVDGDTIVFKLQGKFVIESLPKGTEISSVFGKYTSSLAANGDIITFTRKFEVKEGRYKASTYKEFYDFVMSAAKADNSKAILVRKVKD